MLIGITDKTLEAAKPTSARYPIHDSRYQGLQLVVHPSGRKTWAWRGKVGGVVQKHTLGHYPANSLATARDWAADLIRKRDGGIDPRAEQQRALAAIKADAARDQMTVARAFDLYMDSEGSLRKTAGEKRRMFRRDVELVIGAKPLVSVTHDDIADIIAAKFETAQMASNRLQAMLCRFFRWCVTRGRSATRLTVNPAMDVVKLANERSRDRYLADWEIKLLLRALPLAGNCLSLPLHLLLLTGTRRGEVLEAERAEFDLARGDWLIPANRSKNGKPHLVPLPPSALVLVTNQLASHNRNLLFPSLKGTSEKPVSGISKALGEVQAKMVELAATDGRTIVAWRIHDIRRSVATGMAGLLGDDDQPLVEPHVVEAVLNHVSGAKAGVAGIYNRHSYYASKKAALRLWEKHLNLVEHE